MVLPIHRFFGMMQFSMSYSFQNKVRRPSTRRMIHSSLAANKTSSNNGLLIRKPYS